jgi:F-type H+-transporting ATPase subunit gamma
MATLREIRGRIVGVKKTQKITRAMKMVAAAKLRRAQTNVVQARPYAAKIRELLQHLSANPATGANPFLRERPVHAVALVVVTADRGLCGAFNSNLIRAAESHITANYAELSAQGKVKLFCVGKKGADYFQRHGYALAGRYIGVYNNLVFAQAQMIARDIVQGYSRGEFDRVEIVYNEFKTVVQPRIVFEQFLPVPKAAVEPAVRHTVDYIYEPSDVAILDAIVPKHLNFQIWRVLLESNAAEQGARMAAMENATTNANALISTLQLSYNKARQAAITKELLEIVAGAEALRKAG